MYFVFGFFLFFCIKNKWRLHTTYPKREVLLKAPESLFWEHFCGLSHLEFIRTTHNIIIHRIWFNTTFSCCKHKIYHNDNFNILMCIFCIFLKQCRILRYTIWSYDIRSNPTIHDPTYFPQFYVASQFWQLCPHEMKDICN